MAISGTSESKRENLHENTKMCYLIEKKGRFELITIRNFEEALVKHLNLTAPALDKRDRALKNAGLILSSADRKGAVPVTAADAAYVVLVAVSNAKLEDVVKEVSDLGGLVFRGGRKTPLEGFETLHSALTKLIAPGPKPHIERLVVRPHVKQAEMTLTVGPPGDTLTHKFEYGPAKPRTDLLASESFDIQHEFVARAGFFVVLRNLVEFGDRGEIVDEGQRGTTECTGMLSEENERLALERFTQLLGEEEGKKAMSKWRERYRI